MLRRSDETTCGLHLRKDLLRGAALQAQSYHQKMFSPSPLKIFKISNAQEARPNFDITPITPTKDNIYSNLYNYGYGESKIHSLMSLDDLKTARAELAMITLARAYVYRCEIQGGPWTSGLHLFWRIKNKLEQEPDLQLEDLRTPLPITYKRQIEIAKWSLVDLRLCFISELATQAKAASHKLGAFDTLAEDAAAAVDTLSLRKLLRWLKSDAKPRLEAALPEREYRALGRELRD
jgi:hypothetical protein